MSPAEHRRLRRVRERCRDLRAREVASDGSRRWTFRTMRGALLLYHEFVRDEVQVRAQSLSFFMLLSILPLLAGAFFIFSIFAQFGMVEGAINELVQRFLSEIPGEHRDFIAGYVSQFQHDYLKSLTEKSGSVGIFAILILFWAGLQVFQNVDRLLNNIWSSQRQRTVLESVRNFLVTSVAAPVVLLGALSMPQILHRAANYAHVAERVGFLFALLNVILLPAIVFGLFLCVYRFLPTSRVAWVSAAAGSAFTTVCLLCVNAGMGLYFRYGTSTAYGKAAVVPLLAFWCYAVWLVVLLGAEVSYLLQHADEIYQRPDRDPSLREGQALLAVLAALFAAYRSGKNPVCLERLNATVRRSVTLESNRLIELLGYLEREGWVVTCIVPGRPGEAGYALARDPSGASLRDLLAGFFAVQKEEDQQTENAFLRPWDESLHTWLAAFGDRTVGDLLAKA